MSAFTVNPGGIATVQGPLTLTTVTEIWQQSLTAISSGQIQSIDLEKITMSDSAGLALLLEWLRMSKKAGNCLQFVNFPPQLMAIAKGANISHFFSTG